MYVDSKTLSCRVAMVVIVKSHKVTAFSLQPSRLASQDPLSDVRQLCLPGTLDWRFRRFASGTGERYTAIWLFVKCKPF